MLDAAVADPLTSIPQPIWWVVKLRLRRLEVERQIIVCASRAKSLGAGQFPSQWRGGEEGRAIWDGGSGGSCRHNVVIGVNRWEARRYCKVWLLLLRLRLFLFTAIVLGEGRRKGVKDGKQKEQKTREKNGKSGNIDFCQYAYLNKDCVMQKNPQQFSNMT